MEQRRAELLDEAQVTVAAALGIRARTAQEWHKVAYDTAGADLHEAIHCFFVEQVPHRP